ncbi:MAG: DUF6682 family protein, partial [Thermodesulfobacteriota bacterium]|nr:DUF6682 family protein [Thermodesulfobacteriota bacterium]
MLAAKVISQAMRQYQDLGGDRTTVSAWVDFLNLAQHQVVLHKPDASSVVENMQLAPGVLQSIPTGRMRLLRVFRNMGTDGATPGKVVGLCDQEALGLANLLWPSAEASVAVDNYAFDDLFPEKFWVSPPVHATTAVYVEIGCS